MAASAINKTPDGKSQAIIELGGAKVYTMRELNQRTADVMREINESGRPAMVTRHGRFIAMITPLAGAQVETLVLPEVAAGGRAGGDESAVPADQPPKDLEQSS